MANEYRNPRGTRAALDAKALAGTIVAGQLYLIADQARIAIGLTGTTYQAYLKEGEGGGGGLSDGNKGDVTVSGSGSTILIAEQGIGRTAAIALALHNY